VGADNGKEIELYKIINLNKGDKITFGACRSGCRSYLAIRGVWQLPKWLGSCSPVPYAGISDNLPPPISKHYEISVFYQSMAIFRQIEWQKSKTQQTVARIIPGPEYHLLPGDVQTDFLNRKHIISSQSNRIG
jgi:antagonist of KipI